MATTQVLRDDIIPLLEEHCYEDYDALEQILGSSLVLRERRCINDALFHPSQEADLIRALLEPCPEITASPQAVASDAEAVTEDEDGDDAGESTGA